MNKLTFFQIVNQQFQLENCQNHTFLCHVKLHCAIPTLEHLCLEFGFFVCFFFILWFQIEHDIGGLDGNDGDIIVPIPISKGVAYNVPFGGNYYFGKKTFFKSPKFWMSNQVGTLMGFVPFAAHASKVHRMNVRNLSHFIFRLNNPTNLNLAINMIYD